jgi:DNA helicase-2/ATP-dependent DNA helicase PcrA
MGTLTFNREQELAISAVGKQILVLAGAGTGKTTTITGRCNYLLSNGVPEESILLITFTRRAASEIRSRLESNAKRRTQVIATTFHSWAMNLIRRNPDVFQLDSPTLIDQDDILTIFRKFRNEHKAKSPPKASELAEVHSLTAENKAKQRKTKGHP